MAAVVFKIVILQFLSLYKSLWLYAGAYEVVNVVLGSGISNFVLSLLLIIQYSFAGALYAPRSIFAITFMIDVFAVGGLRLLYRVYRRIVRGVKINMSEVKRVLIFGAGNAGAAIAKEMIKRPKLCSKPVAFVETDPYKIGYKINIKVLDENKYSIEKLC